VSWHTLRHAFVLRLVERGVDIVTVQQLLGHSTVTVMMQCRLQISIQNAPQFEKLAPHCDKSVTVCTTMQRSQPKLSHSRVVSYNVSGS
jgi:hypothetical protein